MHYLKEEIKTKLWYGNADTESHSSWVRTLNKSN